MRIRKLVSAIVLSLLAPNIVACCADARTPETLRPQLRFEENQGQADPRAQFIARTGDGTLFLGRDELVLDLRERRGAAPVRLRLVGADPQALFGAGQLPGRTNYLKGGDRGGWRTGIASYERVRYSEAWPGIDLVVHAASDGHVEFDLFARPLADLGRVRFAAEGVAAARISADGALELDTGTGVLRLRLPVIWEETEGGRRPVAGRFVADGIATSPGAPTFGFSPIPEGRAR